MLQLSLFIAILLCNLFTHTEKIELLPLASSSQTNTTLPITIKITLDSGQALLHDTLSFSTNNPEVTITEWHSNKKPSTIFNTSQKETLLGYQDSVEFNLQLTKKQNSSITTPTTLFMHYMTTTSKVPQEKRFSINFDTTNKVTASDQETPSQSLSTIHESNSSLSAIAEPHKTFSELLYDKFHALLKTALNFVIQSKLFISELLTNSESMSFKFLLAFLLGILMSFTPCIYPMIPITVGLLGTSQGKTFMQNFSLAFAYTLGLATTFALIGLLVTTCGAQCGQFLAHPLFVIGLIIILAYLGGSMFGWYEMKIPRFLQPKNTTVRQGSHASAFLFGVGSGTIASPCMSPGLALVLTIVTALGNKFLGFFLLFVFGLGASLPLLIIGTFSASLHVLPRAGMWMIEVKKIFGFMLFGMCFYYAQIILPQTILFILLASFLACAGLYYYKQLGTSKKALARWLCFMIGTLLITASLYTVYVAIKAFYTHDEIIHSAWRSDYEQAHADAQAQQKYMLLDFGAAWCPACIAIEKQLLNKPEVTQLFDKIIAVHIDGTKQGSEPYASLIKKYAIIGIPTVLLIDPKTGTLIKQWGGELLDQTPTAFAQELENLLR